MRVTAFIILVVLWAGSLKSQDTLWINTGTWNQSADTLPALRFNSSENFDTSNVAIEIPDGTLWNLIVINLDSLVHEFEIQGFENFGGIVLAGDTATFDYPPMNLGTYRYYTSDERGLLLGASGVVKCGIETPLQFHWNLVDWMPSRMDSVVVGANVVWDEEYIPKYFSINSYTFPHTPLDENGYVSLILGDTCSISIVNNGFMDHVLHFHGFHVEIVSSTHQTSRIGWIKDTISILRGEGITVKLIANQPGIYPVHNHNLIAVTNSGFYPGGMFTLINIVQ
ncbi:MAG: hypothetical protein COA49_05690 [Bacteroidetes bacterium]|nr:MAG: hypothetical protein COA49_05690 [Bacteroidota bacterium]